MIDSIIVDTDILIDAALDIGEAKECLSKISRKALPGVSVITYMELMVGCRNKKELSELDNFIARFQMFRLNDRVSDVASELIHDYRLSHGLLIPDALIAATAISVECPLASKNQRDYRFIEKLHLLPYPNLFA